jgi:hypothetical protein
LIVCRLFASLLLSWDGRRGRGGKGIIKVGMDRRRRPWPRLVGFCWRGRTVNNPSALQDTVQRPAERSLPRQEQAALPTPQETVPRSEPAPVPMYATTGVRMRAGPSTDTAILTTLGIGQLVDTYGRDGAWHQVRLGGREGWVHGDYLSKERPQPPRPPAPVPPVARALSPEANRAGQPIRDPVSGSCDCPYDRKSNGASCGRSSAYSRPGGRNPICYF